MPTDRERKKKAMQKRQAEQNSYSYIPGITGGENTYNTSPFGYARGDTTVWKPPEGAYIPPRQTTPPNPPNQPSPPPNAPGNTTPYAAWGRPSQITQVAPYVAPYAPMAGREDPYVYAGQSAAGPGENGFYNQDEYWDTLNSYMGGSEGYRGAGWYGDNGTFSRTLEGVQQRGASRAVEYNPEYGNPSTYNNYTSGKRQGGRNWKYALEKLAENATPENIAAMERSIKEGEYTQGKGPRPSGSWGLSRKKRQLRLMQALSGGDGGRFGGEGGGGGETGTSWLGQLVSFNP